MSRTDGPDRTRSRKGKCSLAVIVDLARLAVNAG
jgi:hypothetical protein